MQGDELYPEQRAESLGPGGTRGDGRSTRIQGLFNEAESTDLLTTWKWR